ncbi:ABC transporter permease [Pusillimonas noertemannii]|uniref:Amino acid/amide ABC transporter membrane protein 1 (HAAT family) /amino acid/amide ABC transporter membrane protein 2 (HAAT family) n=2 Tax=Pusillimonas noertemannii TaxID=305977 RepID=A0A2U1CPA7_9BURK|nr:ABC transporter permease [Pusillimonas noertemannii]NYT67054.1 ABC transporter permease [Pusillimonas noertemannii]PVY67727.1 amino acid/amide ABC transporter membrane protein 1 (HAAT family) /amino acid/amide ABC transporter membrane protein 2 (HAAT family) [Pusillimonas noertemannii]TFL12739.1 ABC transporter permease [Pusillimonas noertemannii]
MDISGFIVQLLNGLAGASSLFLVAAGLSLIFGVTRIVNFAHGSFYMVGIYVAYSLVLTFEDSLGFWPAILLAAIVVGLLGALIEMLLLRRIYHAPELFQLLATFAIALVLRDVVLWYWGPEELLGPRAPGLEGAIEILGRQFPTYDLFLIAAGPVVLGLLWLLLTRTHWGTLVRAATQDRGMVSALGVNQAWLFTAVFALGAFLAALGGALQLPREPANLEMDIHIIGAAFVIVVVGGMGSIPGAYVAALLIAQLKAICVWLGVVEILGVSVSFTKLTLVVEFLVMAVVLILRPWGLFGRPQPVGHKGHHGEKPMVPASMRFKIGVGIFALFLVVLPLLTVDSPYITVLLIDLLVASLFAVSLHFIMGPGGMHSFGHAAYFGLGAYGAALLVRHLGLPMEITLVLAPLVAAVGAFIYGWFCVRLSGVYLAMLTLAVAQITWAIVFQWDDFTGGSNGLTGVWPSAWLSDKTVYYYLTLVLVIAGILWLRRVLFSPFGYAMRAGRDSFLRADAIGINVKRIHWYGFILAGAVAGLAGALFAFSKGSIAPETLHVNKSIDGLVMVLLGGMQTLVGPVVGAVSFTWLHDTVARNTDFWRAMLGGIILLLVLLFPQGIAGTIKQLYDSLASKKADHLGAKGVQL